MYNETKNHIGYDPIAPPAQTNSTAQTGGRLCPMDAKTKRRQRNSERPIAISTDQELTHGFLKCTFLPKLTTIEITAGQTEINTVERDFYQSLSQLSEHYDLKPMDPKPFNYPYNIALALENVKEQLMAKVSGWDHLSLVQDNQKTFLSTHEYYNTKTTLYYIPVLPLYRILKIPQQRKTALLLLSVCSYLYHVAHIPYYRQQGSYLYSMYDMVKDWIIEDDDSDERNLGLQEVIQAEYIGDQMEQKIYNIRNLIFFEQRLNTFKPKNDLDEDCLKLASETFLLYQQYPNEIIFRNAQPPIEEQCDQDDTDFDNTTTMDQYLSFCADDRGALFKHLFDLVNSELQENIKMQEPVIDIDFDGSSRVHKNLDFENRVFEIINQLIFLLNNF